METILREKLCETTLRDYFLRQLLCKRGVFLYGVVIPAPNKFIRFTEGTFRKPYKFIGFLPGWGVTINIPVH